MSEYTKLDAIIEDRRINAALSWILTLFLLLVVVESLLGGDWLWAGFTGTVAVIILIPTAIYRDLSVMLPWEVILLALLPIIGRAIDIAVTPLLTTRVTIYLSVAAVALIIAVELHMFTPVRMNDSFAVLFVVVGTMAASGVWAVVRWLSDLYLGTVFLEDHDIVMWSFVAATAAGILGGIIFTFYFRRFVGIRSRLPEELRTEVISENADR